MNDTVVLVALGAGWLVSMFVIRRWVIREVVASRMPIGTAAVILGLVFSVVPIPSLIWRPEELPLIVFISAVLFFATAGATLAMARILRLR